jgi:hypothetical protein
MSNPCSRRRRRRKDEEEGVACMLYSLEKARRLFNTFLIVFSENGRQTSIFGLYSARTSSEKKLYIAVMLLSAARLQLTACNKLPESVWRCETRANN